MLFIVYVCVGFGAAAASVVDGRDKPPPTGASPGCFKRISGGERLIGYDVTRIVERNTVEECEEECNVYKCTHFSYGNLTGMNGTCELTTDREISRTHDPNFDLYQRTNECAEGKPTGYEKACYRRIVTGKRLHERFIRHSLPCNSLQACQHQCSIEKHFTCQGFNIRLDPARVGRGICELSSFAMTHLDLNRDFVFDPEFAYYERDHDNGLPNCGHFNAVPNAIAAHNSEEGAPGYHPGSSLSGGPYYGGDSYGPWSTGHGTVDHGPWGSRGYGSGFYESNNPSKGPAPSFQPEVPFQHGPYSVYGDRYGYGSGQETQWAGSPFNGYGPSFPLRPGSYGQDFGGGSLNHIYGGRTTPGGSVYNFQPNRQGSYPGYGYGHGNGYRPGDGSSPPGYDDRGPFRPGGEQGPFPGYPGYDSGYTYGYGYGYGYSYSGGSQSFRPQGGRGPGPYGDGGGGGGGGPTTPPRPYGDSGKGPTTGAGSSFQPGLYGDGARGPANGGRSPTAGPGPSFQPGTYGGGGRGPAVGPGLYGDGGRGPAAGLGSSFQPGSYGNEGRGPATGPGPYGNGGRGVPTGSGPSFQPGPYGLRGMSPTDSAKGPHHQWVKPTWQGPSKYPIGDRRYDRPNRIPTYIIIDADSEGGRRGRRPNYQPYGSSSGYPPVGPPALPPPRPPPPPRLPPLYSFPLDGPSPGKFGISPTTTAREVCFRREHPGFKLNGNTVRGMYETPTVLDCEAMCINSPFKCTGYSFRYSSSGSGPNCLLTDHTSLNPETHLLPDRSCDVYFKMGTCMELDRMGNTECFLKVATDRKLDPSKLAKMVTVGGMSECELACLSSDFFTCRSYSFRRGPPVIGEPVENCFLSDWPITALTHQDFIPSPHHEVYERGSFGHGCELDVGPPHIGPRPPFTPYPNVPQISHGKDQWGMGETWRHFTVSGWPCRAGTECELNSEAGFWACEVEGGDRAQWDYCCRPHHSCGYSRGHHYPWCYVGEAGPEQWRPCSEFYYPEFDNRYPYTPVQGHNPLPDDSYGPPRDTRPWNFGSDNYGPPAYWPISFIHAEPPPNETNYWDPEEHVFYHHHHEEHYELHPPEQLQKHPEESPRIRFKPCAHGRPFPRAIVQKLDPKNIPLAANPEEQLKKDERPRGPEAEEPGLGFSPENRDKKKSPEYLPPPVPIHVPGNLTELGPNGENVSSNKTKEVIKEVEKIIMESSTGAEPEKNESLKKVETKHPAFFSLSLLEKPEFWN